ncbi:DUF3307 domain-containing protein [uncultured Roseobacter sp.]|uniref:DUF3307 domain-containing protein n=1 Tax=uncultured Roseobacter sp. TaxID=114847 RepID=UPI003456A3E3
MLLCLLQVKHMLADYFLQTRSMLDGRADYLHMGRLAHVGVHGAGSAIVFLIVGSSLLFVFPLVLAEGIVHYHVDWWKGRYTSEQQLTTADAAYWRASGIDQALHQFTYIGMIWLWGVYGAAGI